MPDFPELPVHRRSLAFSLAAVTGLTGTATRADAAPTAVGGLASFGAVAFDSFVGTDPQKWTAALAYIRAQAMRPTLVMPNRRVVLSAAPAVTMPSGFRMTGPLGGVGREFRTTGEIACPQGGLFAVSGNKDFAITGLSFSSNGGSFLVPSPTSGASGSWSDLTILDCGFYGFGPKFIEASIRRANWDRWYVNSGKNTITISGTDSALWVAGCSYMSGPGNNYPNPFINTAGLANTRLGKMYVTPKGSRAVVCADPRMGFVWDNLTITSWKQTPRPAGAGLTIQGGEGARFNDLLIFGVNEGTQDKGDVMVTGGSGHVFQSPQFCKTYNGYTAPGLAAGQQTPAIYTTVPIRVLSPLAMGGRPKVLGQARAGLIYCDDPSWRIVTG